MAGNSFNVLLFGLGEIEILNYLVVICMGTIFIIVSLAVRKASDALINLPLLCALYWWLLLEGRDVSHSCVILCFSLRKGSNELMPCVFSQLLC